MDPSDHDKRNLLSGPSGGHGPTHDDGGPPGDGWLRSVLENSDEVVKVLDPDGTLRYASPAFGRVFGYDPGEAVGTMNVLDHVHPDDLPRVLEETRRALSQGGAASSRTEYRFRHKDGSWRWVEGVGTYLPDDPAVRGVVVSARDITERKGAEAALRESERRLTSVVSNAHAYAYRCLNEPGWPNEYASGHALELTGYPPEDLLPGGKVSLGDLILEGDRGRVWDEVQEALAEGRGFELRYSIRRRDGRVRHVHEYGRGVPAEDGGVVALEGLIYDVTDRREAEEALRKAEVRYRTLVEQIPAVTYVHVQEPGGFSGTTYVSPQVEVILGYTPEEYTSDPEFWKSILHPDDRRRVLVHDEHTGETGEEFHLEFRMLAKDGRTVWLGENGRLVDIGDDGRQVWHGVLFDITEPKRAEEALREAEERYRTLVERIPAVTYIDRADGSFETLYTSPQIEGLLGYTPEEWVGGKLWEKRLHPDDRERILAADEGLEVHGEPFAEEYRLLAKDGSVVWVREEAVLVRDGEGEPLFWQGVISDLTERRNTEEALRRSEALLAESQRIAHLGTWEWDVATGEVWWSEETYRIHGLEPEGEVDLRGRVEEAFFPEDLPLYRRKIEEALSGEAEGYDYEHRLRRVGGEVRWVHAQAEVVRGEGGEPLRVIGTVHDVTGRKEAEELLEHQAFHDPLIGLPNRRLLLNRLGQALGRARRQEERRVAVLLMDLDNFKVVNDSLGHEAGDLLLVVVAERLRRCLGPEDTLYRFGGDEFVVVVEDAEGPDEAVRMAGRITEELGGPFLVDDRNLYARASIGIALGDGRSHGPEDLLRNADTAMYQAKEEGSGYSVFDSAMYQRAVGRLELEHDLRRAVERGEFVVHYQPIIDLGTGAVWGAEALVRWDHPERGLLGPSEFVTVAEETGLVVPIGKRVLEEACRTTKVWQEAYPGSAPLAVIVNFSATQLRHPECVGTIEGTLRKAGLEAGSLGLDVTESAFIDAREGNGKALGRIKRMGVRISIDDFGTGYSSLSYLKRLPADTIKVDKSFVRGLGEDPEDTAIVRMVVDLAHTLGMEVIAEGVETGEQAAFLKEIGCDMAQGHHFAKPLPPAATLEFLGG